MRVLEVQKTCYFSFCAFWSAGQWGGAIAPPPGYATGRTLYRCSLDSKVEFDTSRTRNIFTAQWVRNKYEFFWSLSESCEQECNKQNVSLQVAYRNKRINSTAGSLLGKVTYLYKNCDKLYWTNWIETTNCSLLRHWDYTRYCEDCDGDEVDEKHCNGNSTMQEDCQLIWSSWIEGDCVVTGCNPTVWERVRTRKCLYGDGKEATQSELCFHQSTTMKKQCNAIKLPSECEQYPSNNSDNTGVYIGVGVGLFLLILVSLLFCCWRKKQQNIADRNKHSSTNIPIDIEHHVYNRIQHNTNRDGCLNPLEVSTLPNDNRQPTIEQPAPTSHLAQPNNKSSTSNQNTRHLQPKMVTSLFLQHGQSSPQDGYEAPINLGNQGQQTESAPGSTSYVNIHTLSPLDGYEVPMRHVANVVSENPLPADNAGYVVFEASNKK